MSVSKENTNTANVTTPISEEREQEEQSKSSSKSKEKRRDKKQKKGKPEKGTPLSMLMDAARLLMKIILVVATFAAVFTFVFGLARIDTDYMVPSVRDGDLVMYYRIDKAFATDELAVLKYEGQDVVGRIIAREGDEVDIDSQGLKINGNYAMEQGIFYDTTQVVDGVTFPLTVPADSVFLLGDNRPNAVDSRIYGCVSIDDLEGKVIMILRRRSF